MRKSIEKFCNVLNSDRAVSDVSATIEMGDALTEICTALKEADANGIDDIADFVPEDLLDNLDKQVIAIILMSFIQHNIEFVLGAVHKLTGIPLSLLRLGGMSNAIDLLRNPEVQDAIAVRLTEMEKEMAGN